MLLETQFSEVISMIRSSRQQAVAQVNKALIDLYWNVGAYIHRQVEEQAWGKSVVKELAAFIQSNDPELKGFSDKNLWRMKQFYAEYQGQPKLSSLMREISWTHNLAIMSRCKSPEERAFYMKTCQEERWSVRVLDRQISSGLYERTLIGKANSAPAIRQVHQNMHQLKDSYVLEFLNLSDTHSESDLQKALIGQMKDFILELGSDFLFIREEYKIQVGQSDFFIDLLFYHRGLQCLVAFELKVDKFKPEHLGQLNFYLEALDRDVRKEHENPSIGILLCKDKDQEVVEYALSRSLSPTMVAEYQMQLPDKALLQRKLHNIIN
ncbi:MAG: PDDEXK nuclease domain-containing protein [Cytophagales bacterium]|nr:PDDEXK nuclease domain-containing protein [Cytophagales bacterium]